MVKHTIISEMIRANRFLDYLTLRCLSIDLGTYPTIDLST